MSSQRMQTKTGDNSSNNTIAPPEMQNPVAAAGWYVTLTQGEGDFLVSFREHVFPENAVPMKNRQPCISDSNMRRRRQSNNDDDDDDDNDVNDGHNDNDDDDDDKDDEDDDRDTNIRYQQ